MTNSRPDVAASSRASWLVRGGVVAGALAYAALAIGSGLDRVAIADPGAASHVPSLFAVHALEVTSEAELLGNPHAAAAKAERLVARAPIEPSSTALLGASRAAIGDDSGADRAFRVAGQLGWRTPVTQSYWLSAALAAGDTRVAAQRLDALLRQRPDLLSRPEMLAPFESDAAAGDALFERLLTRPPWLEAYAGATNPPTPAVLIARRLPVLTMLARRGVVLGCAAIGPALGQLASAGLTSEAATLRHWHCPESAR